MPKSKLGRSQGSGARTQKSSIYGNPKLAPERTAICGIKVSRKPDVIGSRQK